MRKRRGRVSRPQIAVAGFMLAASALLVASPFIAQGRRVTADSRIPSGAAPDSASAQTATRSDDATPSEIATAATVLAQAPSSPAAAKPAPTRTAKPRAAAPVGPSLDAYRGLGSWVDIYDDRAWNDPAAAVRDMARRGVRTLFVETANSRSAWALKDPAALSTFIREAHSHRMRVVAWYLPDMQRASVDLDRIARAIRFRASDGQKFDSFALDIESDAIASVTARNRALESLSHKIRGLVGRSYPLGAIIPSPVGLSKKQGYWDAFPYTMLAQTYDVFVPMSYYTYHGRGYAAAYADTIANVRILRAQQGCSKVPIHLIGGIADNSSPSEVQAFVRAERETRCFGASLYGRAGTSSGHWQQLRAVLP